MALNHYSIICNCKIWEISARNYVLDCLSKLSFRHTMEYHTAVKKRKGVRNTYVCWNEVISRAQCYKKMFSSVKKCTWSILSFVYRRRKIKKKYLRIFIVANKQKPRKNKPETTETDFSRSVIGEWGDRDSRGSHSSLSTLFVRLWLLEPY